MRHLADNAAKYSVGALTIIVIAALLQSGIVSTKADLYRDFVTKAEYLEDSAETKAMLNEIRNDIKLLIRERRNR